MREEGEGEISGDKMGT